MLLPYFLFLFFLFSFLSFFSFFLFLSLPHSAAPGRIAPMPPSVPHWIEVHRTVGRLNAAIEWQNKYNIANHQQFWWRHHYDCARLSNDEKTAVSANPPVSLDFKVRGRLVVNWGKMILLIALGQLGNVLGNEKVQQFIIELIQI